jgi:hypothetical protein
VAACPQANIRRSKAIVILSTRPVFAIMDSVIMDTEDQYSRWQAARPGVTCRFGKTVANPAREYEMFGSSRGTFHRQPYHCSPIKP